MTKHQGKPPFEGKNKDKFFFCPTAIQFNNSKNNDGLMTFQAITTTLFTTVTTNVTKEIG